MRCPAWLGGFLLGLVFLTIAIARAESDTAPSPPPPSESETAAPVPAEAAPEPSEPVKSEAAEPAAAEATYVGDAVCTSCHDGLQAKWGRTVHAKLFTEDNWITPTMRHGCEGCHGPGSAHVEAGGGRGVGGMLAFRGADADARQREAAVCLGCHSGRERVHWQSSAHESRDVTCTSCHRIMESVSQHGLLAHANEVDTCATCHPLQQARQFRTAHMPVREGKMSCSSCHNPHGTITQSLLRYDSVNDNCLSCHADKRGPFLWEHPPVVENCLNCHDPHGSPRAGMLKVSPPRLCQQCHLATRHPSSPRAPNDRFVVGSSCLECHVNIHGSNHPSGFVFTR